MPPLPGTHQDLPPSMSSLWQRGRLVEAQEVLAWGCLHTLFQRYWGPGSSGEAGKEPQPGSPSPQQWSASPERLTFPTPESIPCSAPLTWSCPTVCHSQPITTWRPEQFQKHPSKHTDIPSCLWCKGKTPNSLLARALRHQAASGPLHGCVLTLFSLCLNAASSEPSPSTCSQPPPLFHLIQVHFPHRP